MLSVPPEIDSGGALDRRQRWLLALAWSATLLPLAVFGYLTRQSFVLNERVQATQLALKTEQTKLDAVQREINTAKAALAKATADLDEQRKNTRHYRRFAGIRIRFYRESDRTVVGKALADQGFDIDTELGHSTLIDRQPNTIGYGGNVSVEDRRDIAVALVEAGFPLKRIARAVRQQFPNLLQIYASVQTDNDCGLLSVELIRNGETCGPKHVQ